MDALTFAGFDSFRRISPATLARALFSMFVVNRADGGKPISYRQWAELCNSRGLCRLTHVDTLRSVRATDAASSCRFDSRWLITAHGGPLCGRRAVRLAEMYTGVTS